jgi:transposase-like protein
VPRKGQEKGTPARRAEFIEYLRKIGPGHLCIKWPWSAVRGDYVPIHVNGEKVRAHRWVYEQVYGVDLVRTHKRGVGEEVILHTCDNRACVRPSHLLLSGQLENMRDAAAKGRLSSSARRKLSLDDAAEIRRLHAGGHTQAGIARAFGVSVNAVHLVVHGVTLTGRGHGNRRLADEQVAEIRRVVMSGSTQSSVARAYGVTPSAISQIVNHRTR